MVNKDAVHFQTRFVAKTKVVVISISRILPAKIVIFVFQYTAVQKDSRASILVAKRMGKDSLQILPGFNCISFLVQALKFTCSDFEWAIKCWRNDGMKRSFFP